jgi:hypothetical protein
VVWVGTDGGISKKNTSSTLGGWESLNDGLQVSLIWSFDDYDFDKDFMVIGNQACGTNMLTDLNKKSWKIIAGCDGYGVQIPDYDNDTIFILPSYTSLIRRPNSRPIESKCLPKDPVKGWEAELPGTF